VIHAHSRAGTAVSRMEGGLQFTCQTALMFDGNLSYHDFEGAAGPEDERQRLADDLGSNFNMILHNHSLLACGSTVGEAFVNIHELEVACQTQVDLLKSGAKIIYPTAEARANNHQVMAAFRAKHGYQPEWRAMLRRLDRIDGSYRN
jgi:ribulose-5-phosphate 4-epimerase/fuculose-1-phosphate aldolase